MLSEDTIRLQNQLAQYCRDGKMIELEGSKAENLPHYRRLVFNVMYGIIENAFPIAKSVLAQEDFRKLVDIYLSSHDAKESQVWKVPGEFQEYFRQHPPLLVEKHPYLLDLLQMEWMEILVYNREDRPRVNYLKGIIDWQVPLIVNPDSALLELNYPVFRGNWNEMSAQKGKYLLLLFRNVENHKVQFLAISPLHKALIELLEQGIGIEDAMESIGAQVDVKTEMLQDQIKRFVQELTDKGFILGKAQ